MSMAVGHFAVGTGGIMVMFHMLPLRIRFKTKNSAGVYYCYARGDVGNVT